MLLLNSVLIILVLQILEKVGAGENVAEKPVLRSQQEEVDIALVNTDKSFILKISPQAVVKTFRAVVSSDYVHNLAEEFAQKAAAHFMTIMKETQENKFRQNKLPNVTEVNHIDKPVIKKKARPFNKKEVMTLLKDPPIDGDDLQQTLSDEISETTEGNTVRVKINGAYYKRQNLPVKTVLFSTAEVNNTKLLETLKTTDITTEKMNGTKPVKTVLFSTVEVNNTKLLETLKPTDITTEKMNGTKLIPNL